MAGMGNDNSNNTDDIEGFDDTQSTDNVVKLPQLQRGDTDLWVTRLQQHLKRRGYAVVCCGLFGPATEISLCAFQHKYRLPVTGIVDAQTWVRLIAN